MFLCDYLRSPSSPGGAAPPSPPLLAFAAIFAAAAGRDAQSGGPPASLGPRVLRIVADCAALKAELVSQ